MDIEYYNQIADRVSSYTPVRDAIARKMQAAETKHGVPDPDDVRPHRWARREVLEELIDALAYLSLSELAHSDMALILHQYVIEFYSPEELAKV